MERNNLREYSTITFDYRESNGFHCEPNPHVDGLLHYQERDDTHDAYTYESVSFDARSVPGLLWEVMDALADRLDDSE